MDPRSQVSTLPDELSNINKRYTNTIHKNNGLMHKCATCTKQQQCAIQIAMRIKRVELHYILRVVFNVNGMYNKHMLYMSIHNIHHIVLLLQFSSMYNDHNNLRNFAVTVVLITQRRWWRGRVKKVKTRSFGQTAISSNENNNNKIPICHIFLVRIYTHHPQTSLFLARPATYKHVPTRVVDADAYIILRTKYNIYNNRPIKYHFPTGQ